MEAACQQMNGWAKHGTSTQGILFQNYSIIPALKRHEIPTQAATGINLEDNMLSKISQSQKDNIVWFHVHEAFSQNPNKLLHYTGESTNGKVAHQSAHIVQQADLPPAESSATRPSSYVTWTVDQQWMLRLLGQSAWVRIPASIKLCDLEQVSLPLVPPFPLLKNGHNNVYLIGFCED